MTTTRVLLTLALAALAGCAARPAGDAEPSEPAADTNARADQGAGARPVVRPAERTTPRLDPAMQSQGSTALSRPTPAPNAAVAPVTPGEWQPDWHTGTVTVADNARVGSAVATHRDLLEARRQAVAAAFDLLDQGTIDQTVTRQLDDGRYRVWVRIAAN